MRKNKNSYVKTLDSYFTLLTNDNEMVGEIRIILFLEDLGPIELYEESEKQIDQEILKRGLQGMIYNDY